MSLSISNMYLKMFTNQIEIGIKHAFARPWLRQEPAQEVKASKPCRINQESRQSPRLKTISKRQGEARRKDRGAQTSHNTRLLGGQSAAANCRFDASVTVHSLCSGGVMSAMRQLQQAWNVVAAINLNNEIDSLPPEAKERAKKLIAFISLKGKHYGC